MMKTFTDDTILQVFEEGGGFEVFSKLMAETARGSQAVSTNVANERIREKMFELLKLRPEDLNVDRKFRKAMKDNGDRMFEVIIETVEDALVQGWKTDSFFMEWVEFKNHADGDINEFYVDEETIVTVHRVSGGHHDFTLQTGTMGQTYSVSVARYGAAIGADIRLFLAGRIDWQKLINALVKAFDQQLKSQIYEQALGFSSSIPVNSALNATGPMTTAGKDLLDGLISDVKAYNDGDDVVIFGTDVAIRSLEKLVDVDWLPNSAKEERYKTGRLGYYGGIGLVEIPQQLLRRNGTVSKMIDTKTLFVLPVSMGKFIKVFYQGNPDILAVDEKGANMLDLKSYEYQTSYGVTTIFGKYGGKFKITE